MCGLAGMILGRQQRTVDDFEYIRHLLSRLLVVSERRGPHATGVAVIREDGTCSLRKAPLPAHKFVVSGAYAHLVAAIDQRTTLLVGHTRWATRGPATNNRNNHPLKCGLVVGTHNGTITNANVVFRQFGLRRQAQVDSEALFRLAELRAGMDGIDVPRWLEDLSHCRGDLAAVAVSLAQPSHLVMVRRDRPLAFAYHAERHILVYASERAIIERATDGDPDWQHYELAPMQVLEFCCETLPAADAWLLPALPGSKWERYRG